MSRSKLGIGLLQAAMQHSQLKHGLLVKETPLP